MPADNQERGAGPGMSANRPGTVADVLHAAADYLTVRDIHEPRQACDALMSRLLKCKRLELYVRFDSPLTAEQLAAMRRGVKRLAAGEPVQYILGEVEFMGHSFKADRRALIPRPETELLVETVLGCEALWRAESPLIADVGTGSGCIVTSLALAKPRARYLALDVSREALELAAENAAAHGVVGMITFAGADMSACADPDSIDAIAANLPYVPTEEWEKLPAHIRQFEPRTALDGGKDGLAVISQFVPDAWFVLKPGGLLFLEIGADQAERVVALLDRSGFGRAVVRQDLAGHDRVVIGARQESA